MMRVGKAPHRATRAAIVPGLLCHPGVQTAATEPPTPAGVDAPVKRAMQVFDGPGMAVATVRHDRVVMSLLRAINRDPWRSNATITPEDGVLRQRFESGGLVGTLHPLSDGLSVVL